MVRLKESVERELEIDAVGFGSNGLRGMTREPVRMRYHRRLQSNRRVCWEQEEKEAKGWNVRKIKLSKHQLVSQAVNVMDKLLTTTSAPFAFTFRRIPNHLPSDNPLPLPSSDPSRTSRRI